MDFANETYLDLMHNTDLCIELFHILEEVENKDDIIQQLFQQLPNTVKSYFKFLPAYSKLDLSKLNYQKEIYFTYCIDRNHVQVPNKTFVYNVYIY